MAKRNESEVGLPGLEDALTPMDMRPAGVDMSDEKVYTAALLFRDHPRVFKSACNLLFKNGLSERSVAAALYLSVNTVRAIRDMVTSASANATDSEAAAFFIKSRIRNSRRLVQLRALEALEDKLTDERKVEELKVDTLLSAIKTIQELEKPVEEKPEEKPTKKEAEIYDINADQFDDVLNGLNEEKKSARGDAVPGDDAEGAAVGSEDGAERAAGGSAGAAQCSAGNAEFSADSISLSEYAQ